MAPHEIVRALSVAATTARFRARHIANVARSAVDFGLLPEAEVAEIEKQQGSRAQDLAHDLFAYPTLFFKYWERVKGRTPVTRELLDEAQASGLQPMALVATDSDDPTARPADSTPPATASPRRGRPSSKTGTPAAARSPTSAGTTATSTSGARPCAEGREARGRPGEGREARLTRGRRPRSLLAG